jgi:hypothetical protein
LSVAISAVHSDARGAESEVATNLFESEHVKAALKTSAASETVYEDALGAIKVFGLVTSAVGCIAGYGGNQRT